MRISQYFRNIHLEADLMPRADQRTKILTWCFWLPINSVEHLFLFPSRGGHEATILYATQTQVNTFTCWENHHGFPGIVASTGGGGYSGADWVLIQEGDGSVGSSQV